MELSMCDNIRLLLTMLYGVRGGKHLLKAAPDALDQLRSGLLGIMLPLPLNNVELRQSRVHGRGVFATRKIIKNDVVTLYPGDVVTYHPGGRSNDPSKIVYDFYGDGLSESSKTSHMKNRLRYKDYKNSIISSYDVIGTPENDKNPAYLGHFINDAVRCTNDERSVLIYTTETLAKANCAFRSINDLHIAVIATRDIEIGEELYIPYGATYWMER